MHLDVDADGTLDELIVSKDWRSLSITTRGTTLGPFELDMRRASLSLIDTTGDGIDDLVAVSDERVVVFDVWTRHAFSRSTDADDYVARTEASLGGASSLPSLTARTHEVVAASTDAVLACVDADSEGTYVGSHTFSTRVDASSARSELSATVHTPDTLTRCVEAVVDTLTLPAAPEGTSHTVRLTLRVSSNLVPK